MEVEPLPGGKLLVMLAESDADTQALGARAALLARLRHPGLIHLVDAGPIGDGRWRLRVRWVGASLAELDRPADPSEIAGLGAAVASTIGDLHALGWVHGAVRAEHVLLDAAGRPVLCGLGAARQTRDPSARTVDHHDLVELLERLIPPGASTGEWRGLRRVLHHSRRGERDLSALARGLASPRFGARLLVPARPDRDSGPTEPAGHDDHTPARAAEGPPRGRSRRGGSHRRLVAGLVVAAVSAALAAGIGGHHRVQAAVRCPAVDGACRAHVLPDGTLLTAAGRYSVGVAGDVVVLGRWDCGSVGLPAVLDPSTGGVWVFDRWPIPGADVAGRWVGRVPGGVSAAVVPGSTGCDRVKVLRAGGPSVELRPGGGP